MQPRPGYAGFLSSRSPSSWTEGSENQGVAREPGHGTRSRSLERTTSTRGAPVLELGARGSARWSMVHRKVDVVQWREDPAQLIAEALGPAKVQRSGSTRRSRGCAWWWSATTSSTWPSGARGWNAGWPPDSLATGSNISSESEEAGGTVASRAGSAPLVAEVPTARPVREPIAATEQVVEPAVATAETVVESSEDVVEPAPETSERG